MLQWGRLVFGLFVRFRVTLLPDPGGNDCRKFDHIYAPSFCSPSPLLPGPDLMIVVHVILGEQTYRVDGPSCSTVYSAFFLLLLLLGTCTEGHMLILVR